MYLNQLFVTTLDYEHHISLPPLNIPFLIKHPTCCLVNKGPYSKTCLWTNSGELDGRTQGSWTNSGEFIRGTTVS